jgi:hypothetical protein
VPELRAQGIAAGIRRPGEGPYRLRDVLVRFLPFGIRISRTWVPTGVPFHAMGTTPEELRKTVPEYTVVYPPPAADPEDFEEVTF